MRDRGWAGVLLSWRWAGSLLTAEISAARYFVRSERHEVVAWCEVREPGGRYRIEVGTFGSVGDARAACEADAQLRCRRDQEERAPVDVRIARRRRVAAKADKGRELAGGNYRPREAVVERDAGEALDAALAAFAGVLED
jgi:hypothetical protein